MQVNAMTEEFEHIEIFGKPVLFTNASGEQIEYTDPAEYLKAIQEELPFHATTGFRFEVLTSDPEVRKAADDAPYDLYSEENPRKLEDCQEQPEQSITMGGIQL